MAGLSGSARSPKRRGLDGGPRGRGPRLAAGSRQGAASDRVGQLVLRSGCAKRRLATGVVGRWRRAPLNSGRLSGCGRLLQPLRGWPGMIANVSPPTPKNSSR